MGSIPVAKPSPIPRWSFPRRGFALALILLTAFAFAGVMLAVTWPEEDSVDRARWADGGLVADLNVGQPVRPAGQSFWLVRGEDGGVTALVARSPHLGCLIAWREDQVFQGQRGWFRDQCSGSNFDLNGAIFSGPSPRGMDSFQVSIIDGRMRVNVEEVICRDGLSRCGPPNLKPLPRPFEFE